MSDGERSETSVEMGPQPQQQLQMLFNEEDFEEQVVKDVENLCCIVVTSTLCSHSGVHKIRYPKFVLPGQEKKPANSDDDEEGEEEAEEEEAEEEDDEAEARGKRSHFFDDLKAKLITTTRDLKQRRHVRFFHVCACTVDETNIKPLVAKDVAFSVTGRKPNEVETAELKQTAYEQLVKLLHTLEVRSTPCLLFFVRGLRLRYSLMGDSVDPGNKVNPMGEKDWIVAHGANLVKWRKIFMNAVVVRNEMLKEYDAEVRARLRAERKEKRKQERLERKRRQAEEEAEEDEEEDD
eukprot:gene7302-5144_t